MSELIEEGTVRLFNRGVLRLNIRGNGLAALTDRRNDRQQQCRRRVAPEQFAFKICRLQREEPELYGKIKAFLSLKDFVNCKLTGISAIDHTTASYSLLYDVEKR